MNQVDKKEEIIKIISEKSVLKQHVFDNTYNTFLDLKSVLNYIANNFNSNLQGIDKRVYLEYKDQGIFDAQLKVAGDLLVFNMHSNAFEFDRNHTIWKLSYVEKNPLSSICGMISVYNFLNDSFRYNREDDLGYLIARIFINKDKYYFVEGKRQMGYWINNFGTTQINKETLRDIVYSAIQYSLEFDLLVPPYDSVKIVSVAQINSHIESSRMQTGKRLGFTFNSDDISAETKLDF
jgi:thermostable 8-oxoguanine DNA glycosylase